MAKVSGEGAKREIDDDIAAEEAAGDDSGDYDVD